MDKKNGVATVLKIIGFLIAVIGFFAGLSAGEGYGHELDMKIILQYWGITILFAVLIFGFSEIINLLQQILNKQNSEDNKSNR